MGSILQTTLIAIITVLTCMQIHGYPLESGDCRAATDCGPNECCVLGMMRYSMPLCMPLGQVEDYCREDATPENRTLTYPSGDPVEVIDIFTHVCPCDNGMQCIDNFCALDESYDNNYLY